MKEVPLQASSSEWIRVGGGVSQAEAEPRPGSVRRSSLVGWIGFWILVQIRIDWMISILTFGVMQFSSVSVDKSILKPLMNSSS